MIWQSIETAPRDGRVILACDERRWPVLVFWSNWLEDHWQPLGHSWREAKPSHWAPIPEPSCAGV